MTLTALFGKGPKKENRTQDEIKLVDATPRST
jgi:hypothetical protein